MTTDCEDRISSQDVAIGMLSDERDELRSENDRLSAENGRLSAELTVAQAELAARTEIWERIERMANCAEEISALRTELETAQKALDVALAEMGRMSEATIPDRAASYFDGQKSLDGIRADERQQAAEAGAKAMQQSCMNEICGLCNSNSFDGWFCDDFHVSIQNPEMRILCDARYIRSIDPAVVARAALHKLGQ